MDWKQKVKSELLESEEDEENVDMIKCLLRNAFSTSFQFIFIINPITLG